MPAIASLEDLRAAQKDLLAAKDLWGGDGIKSLGAVAQTDFMLRQAQHERKAI